MPKRPIVIDTLHGRLEVTGRDRTLTHLCVGPGPSIHYGSNDLVKAHRYAAKYSLIVVFNPKEG